MIRPGHYMHGESSTIAEGNENCVLTFGLSESVGKARGIVIF